MRIYGSLVLAAVLGVAVVAAQARSDANDESGSSAGDIERPRDDIPKALDTAEIIRRWRCSQCQVNMDGCFAQARLIETTCTQNNKSNAEWRCNRDGKDGDGIPSVTAWGCSIDHLRGELCTVAGKWNDSALWETECRGWRDYDSGSGTCMGPARYNCEQSWATHVPGGSTDLVRYATFSVQFAGVGGSESKAITATFESTPQLGYLAACAALSSKLVAGCTKQLGACYADQHCTKVDAP